MGNFIIKPTSLFLGGTPIIDGASVPPGYEGWAIDDFPTYGILDAMRSDSNVNPGPGTGFFNLDALVDGGSGISYSNTLRFTFIGASTYLDGSLVPIEFSGLPSGFRPLTAVVAIVNEFGVFGTAQYQLQQSNLDDGTINTDTFPYDFTPPAPTMLDIYSNGCGLKVNLPSPGDLVAVLYGLTVSGTYDILSFSFTVDTPTVKIGDTVSISATDSLDEVDDLLLQYVDPITGELTQTTIPKAAFATQSPTEITFILTSAEIPSDFSGNVGIWGVGSGTQFSGTVALGTLTVFIIDGSGVYRLVTNKTNDTQYIDSASGDDIIDVAIPEPFIRTGYIGG